MKAFSLEEYLKNPSRKVVTRDGRNVRIICTDKRGTDFPIVALVECEDKEETCYYASTGCWNLYEEESDIDLFFASEKHEGYACIHFNEGIYYLDDTIYSSKEEADNNAKKWSDSIAVTKIEWEE